MAHAKSVRTSKRPPQGGRPCGGSAYDPRHAAKAADMAAAGATDAELAAAFGVARNTIFDWRGKYPDFAAACARGKAAADDAVEKSLHQRATGQATYKEQRAVMVDGKPEIITLQQGALADVGAARLWLMNRRPKDWRERDRVEFDDDPAQPVEVRIISQSARIEPGAEK